MQFVVSSPRLCWLVRAGHTAHQVNAVDQQVLIQVLHTLFLEEKHFIVGTVHLQQSWLNALERVAKIGYEVGLATVGVMSHYTFESPSVILIVVE